MMSQSDIPEEEQQDDPATSGRARPTTTGDFGLPKVVSVDAEADDGMPFPSAENSDTEITTSTRSKNNSATNRRTPSSSNKISGGGRRGRGGRKKSSNSETMIYGGLGAAVFMVIVTVILMSTGSDTTSSPSRKRRSTRGNRSLSGSAHQRSSGTRMPEPSLDAQQRLQRRQKWGKAGGAFKDDGQENEDPQPNSPPSPVQPDEDPIIPPAPCAAEKAARDKAAAEKLAAEDELRKGDAFLDRKDWDTAIACFGEAIRLDPN
ncbi:MAG: tetratricopeptide repeat protein, partial [Pirellulales bacterium]